MDAKKIAHSEVKKALRQGILVRSEVCSFCGDDRAKRIVAHHADYSKPLEVEWLCVSCYLGLAHSDLFNNQERKQKIRKDRKSRYRRLREYRKSIGLVLNNARSGF